MVLVCDVSDSRNHASLARAEQSRHIDLGMLVYLLEFLLVLSVVFDDRSLIATDVVTVFWDISTQNTFKGLLWLPLPVGFYAVGEHRKWDVICAAAGAAEFPHHAHRAVGVASVDEDGRGAL